MALSKIRSESVDLADDFAFTGTVTGAGSNSGYRFISKTDFTTTGAVYDFTNIFDANYKHYRMIWDIVGTDNTADVSHSWMMIKASDGSIDTTADIDYQAHGRDTDGSGRSVSNNNEDHFNFLYNTAEVNTHAFYEMSMFNPFVAEQTVCSGLVAYMVNANTDSTTSNYSFHRSNTTSYSGLRLIGVDTNNSKTPDTSVTLTGTLILYGIAES